MGRERSPRQFTLIRWFSLFSFCVISIVSILFAAVMTRFLSIEGIARDARLTAQFIQAIAEEEARHAGLGPGLSMGGLLDPRRPSNGSEARQLRLAQMRQEFFDDVARLPDARLAHIFAPDRVIVWSTNPQLIGQRIVDAQLDKAFEGGEPVSAGYSKVSKERIEQHFLPPSEGVFIESYIPLLDASGQVTAVIEVYKEPADLLARIHRGYLLIWLLTALSGAMIYAGLFWIVWRASDLLDRQQKQLIANETFVALGEMSSAVAHSLRNPLAAIRSSAELAQEADAATARKSIDDIIGQVDRLSKWVRELLLSSRPLRDEYQAVDAIAVVNEALDAFAQQIRQAGIRVDWQARPSPAVISHPVLLAQVLNSVLANAIEAMPSGGVLRVSAVADVIEHRLCLCVSDSGEGMSREQMAMAFKAFYTTKRSGLGVGLVLVKRVMERFGGEVRLASRERVGTDVRLEFRIAQQG